MNNAEHILEIVDKNGFDWWGMTKNIVLPIDADFIGTFICIFSFNNGAQIIPTKYYSLADLATNKSFLEAVNKLRKKEEYEVRPFQGALIDDLTNNNGKDFWSICSEFIGELNNE